MGAPDTASSLRAQLLSLFDQWDVQIDGGVHADTPLIDSGQFDSFALFNLALWIEQQVGTTIDMTSIDLATEWNSVNDILRFIERRRGPER